VVSASNSGGVSSRGVQREHLDQGNDDRNLPALRALTRDRSINQIIGLVGENIVDKELARKISIHLCHRFSGEKLRNIGERFGLSEPGVTQASRRMADKTEKNKLLGQWLKEIKERLGLYDV
jgi:hypothetical protein